MTAVFVDPEPWDAPDRRGLRPVDGLGLTVEARGACTDLPSARAAAARVLAAAAALEATHHLLHGWSRCPVCGLSAEAHQLVETLASADQAPVAPAAVAGKAAWATPQALADALVDAACDATAAVSLCRRSLHPLGECVCTIATHPCCGHVLTLAHEVSRERRFAR